MKYLRSKFLEKLYYFISKILYLNIFLCFNYFLKIIKNYNFKGKR